MKSAWIRSLAAAVTVLVPACGGEKAATAILLASSQAQFSAIEGGADPPDQTLSIIGADGLLFGYTSWTATSDQPWLTVSPATGIIRTGETRALTLQVTATLQAEQWLGPTQTTGAPPNGCGVWTGSSLLVWQGDPAIPGKFYNPVSDSWSGATSTVGAPSLRSTTAVWTGTEMIVWGGIGPGGVPLDTGARYNPATDTWTPMSTVGAPAPRFSFSSVWTGTRYIVWGGDSGGFSYKNTGGIYDPSTDTWVGATTLAGAPSPRGHCAAVWTGTRMLIWGGENPAKFNTGHFFDPVANAWTGTTSTVGAPSGRSHQPGVWNGREMIVWGGGTGGPHLNTGARYNPATDSWKDTVVTNAPAGRASHLMVWTGSRMIVWGGEINGPLTNTGALWQPPIPGSGTHQATVTLTPDQGPPLSFAVTLTVAP